MHQLSLKGIWQLTYAEGAMLHPQSYFLGTKLDTACILDAPVPAPIHEVLMQAGWLDDVNIGMNSLKARWVEEMFWIYRKEFEVPAASARQNCRLVFERLEFAAVVFLNGEEIGRHANAHRPAIFDITGKLTTGKNLIVVQIEAGLYHGVDKSTAYGWPQSIDALTRRPWMRKPQYQVGWDWNARLQNVGILGDVRVDFCDGVWMDDVTVFAQCSEDLSTAALEIRATLTAAKGQTYEVQFCAKLQQTGQENIQRCQITDQPQRQMLKLIVDKPRLWWPIGHGDQPLYDVAITVSYPGGTQHAARRTGFRHVAVDQSAHPQTGQYFIVKINHRPIFCKGGNWVPADLLYSRVSAQRYRQLVQLAVQANFNTLRIWGGGLFADQALCDACDEMGVLIWHDFLFACAKYPAHIPEFAAEVHQEIRYGVRHWAHHPALVVWCGNNEIEWGDWCWSYDRSEPRDVHHALFHRDIPRILAQEDASKFYWPSSPYSSIHVTPNSPTSGDQHPWDDLLHSSTGSDWWVFRQYVDRFPNEGGILGASSPATLKQFLPKNEQHLFSPSWQHHDNPFSAVNPQPGEPGRSYQTLTLWTGLDARKMDLDQYVYISALLQAEGLSEYINNYRRRMFSSAAAIFWMYNDSWPVTHGWTIVDYYLRKKLSYHPVRRAFAPVTVVVAQDDDTIRVFGINDTRENVKASLRWGLFTLGGTFPADDKKPVTLAPNASTPLADISLAQWRQQGLDQTGAFAVLEQNGQIIGQHRLFLKRFGELQFVPAEIQIKRRDGSIYLTSSTFAWGVCLDVNGEIELADNCFDLLPGTPYRITWPDTLAAPAIVENAGGFLLKLLR